VLALGAIACAAGAADSSAKAKSQPVTTMRLVFETPSAGNVTGLLAMKEGFFARNHIAITPETIPAGPATTAALLGGSADIGYLGITNMAPLLAQGQKMVLVSELNVNYWTLMTSPALAGGSLSSVLHSLAGKTVSAPSVGGEGAAYLRYLETTYGLPTSAISLTADPSNSAVLSGSSAAAMTDTIGACVLSTHGFKQAFSFNEAPTSQYPAAVRGFMRIPDLGYWVTGTYAAAHPQALKEFQTAIHETIAWMQSHVSQAVKVLVANQTTLGYPSMAGNEYPTCMKQIIAEGATTISPSELSNWNQLLQAENIATGLPPSSQWTIPGVVKGK
jgi:ABC-type nitrate/sulfonate/bicarbonate transport system substrate-binding protein